VKPLSADGTAS